MSSLPERANLEWLRKTAKHRLKTLRAAQPAARLADAQLAVAREHGFTSWRALKAHVDRLATARDQEHDATPRGWAETSVEVTRNEVCAEVARFLDGSDG